MRGLVEHFVLAVWIPDDRVTACIWQGVWMDGTEASLSALWGHRVCGMFGKGDLVFLRLVSDIFFFFPF